MVWLRMILLVSLLGLLWWMPVEAACSGSSPTWLAATNGVADVQACVNVASAGDTINIPTGSGAVTWATTLTISNKCLSLIGPGSASLTITDATDYTLSTYGLLTWVTANDGFLCRLSGITINLGNRASTGSNKGSLNISGNTPKWRFDHWVMYGSIATSSPIGFMFYRGFVRGVVDHWAIHLNAYSIPIYVFHDAWNNNANGCAGPQANGCGDAAWADDSKFGTADFLYFEDGICDVNGQNRNGGAAYYCIDGWAGSRYVWRFTTNTDTYIANHGADSGGRQRSARAHEVYNNRVNATTAGMAGWFGLRGGTGRFFQISTAQNYPTTPGFFNTAEIITLSNYRNCPLAGFYQEECAQFFWRSDQVPVTMTSSGTTATASLVVGTGAYAQLFMGTPNSLGVWVKIFGDANFTGTYQVIPGTVTSTTFQFVFAGCGGCTSSVTKATSAWDQTVNNYQIVDQVGAGRGDLIGSGTNPSPVWLNQIIDPVYAINVYKNGTLQTSGGDGAVTLANRDWFTHNPSFNGTTQHGVGVGLRSSRPTACGLNDGWWATNDSNNWNTSTTETYSALFGFPSGQDGALDRCTVAGNPGTWANASYVPYTYPHPLVGGSVLPDVTPPSVPTGVVITKVSP